jgi:hypothetical protein
MSYRAAFITDAIGDDDPHALELALKHMGHMLWCLVKINEDTLVAYPDRFPPLFSSGIVYGEPNIVLCAGVDDNWIDIVTLYEIMRGTCKELAAARIAELRVRYGIPATPCITMEESSSGRDEYHVMVRWPNTPPPRTSRWPGGFPKTVYFDPELKMNVECPSSVLGMGRVAA